MSDVKLTLEPELETPAPGIPTLTLDGVEEEKPVAPEKKEEALYDLEEASSKVYADQMSTNFLSILNTKLQNLSGLLAGSEAVCQLINTAVSILEKIKG